MARKKASKWIGAQEDGKVKTTIFVRKETLDALRDYAARRLARSRGGGLKVSEALDSLVRIAFECILRHTTSEEEPRPWSYEEAQQAGLSILKTRRVNKTATIVDGERIDDPEDDEI